MYAQDSTLVAGKRNQIIVSSGYSKHIIRDDVISPYIYKGIQAPVWIKYNHSGNKYLHRFQVYYSSLELESVITNSDNYFEHYSQNINGLFSYSLTRKIYTFKKAGIDLYIGGKYKSFLNYRQHYYTENSQSTTGEQSNSLDFISSVYKKYNSSGDIFSFSLNFPVISYVLLSDMFNANVSTQINEIDPHKNLITQFIKNGDFVFIDKQFEFQSELSIYKSINQFFALGISHNFHFYSFEKHPDISRTTYANNQLIIDLILKF